MNRISHLSSRAASVCTSVWFFALLLLPPMPVNAQTMAEKLDALFSHYNTIGLFNGVVLAAQDGNVIYERSFGFSDFENKIPMKMTDVFSIGSITKPFTATAIMMLQERGRLSYDDRLSKYFPDFPKYMESITLRHLLTHTSGIVDYLNDLKLLDKLPEVTTAVAIDSLRLQAALEFEPGTKYEYSNSGYLLLARVIEKVTGTTFQDFLEENIFRPLGMHHTFAYSENADDVPGRIKSYKGFWEESDYDLKLKAIGNGNIYSTIGDLLYFDRALYTDDLVSQKTLREAYDTTKLVETGRSYFYSFGWRISTTQQNERIVYHHGGLAGYRGELWRNIDSKRTLIVLSNNIWISRDPNILESAQNIMLAKEYSLGKMPVWELFHENFYFKGFPAAMSILRSSRDNSFQHYDFNEDGINDLGYWLLSRNEIPQAVEMFTFNVGLYPESFNAHDSLGEAHLAAGDTTASIAQYRKALMLNPECKTAQKALEKLSRN